MSRSAAMLIDIPKNESPPRAKERRSGLQILQFVVVLLWLAAGALLALAEILGL